MLPRQNFASVAEGQHRKILTGSWQPLICLQICSVAKPYLSESALWSRTNGVRETPQPTRTKHPCEPTTKLVSTKPNHIKPTTLRVYTTQHAAQHITPHTGLLPRGRAGGRTGGSLHATPALSTPAGHPAIQAFARNHSNLLSYRSSTARPPVRMAASFAAGHHLVSRRLSYLGQTEVRAQGERSCA